MATTRRNPHDSRAYSAEPRDPEAFTARFDRLYSRMACDFETHGVDLNARMVALAQRNLAIGRWPSCGERSVHL